MDYGLSWNPFLPLVDSQVPYLFLLLPPHSFVPMGLATTLIYGQTGSYASEHLSAESSPSSFSPSLATQCLAFPIARDAPTGSATAICHDPLLVGHPSRVSHPV